MNLLHLHHLRIFAAPALLGFACAVLAGCANTSAPVTQRVDVPVPVSCVKAEDVPAKPIYQFDRLPATASDGEKVIALANDWLAGRKYEGLLSASLNGCVR